MTLCLRFNADAVELGDYLYVFGGTKEERGTMERYSLSEEKWEQCEPLLPHSG